MKIRGFLIGLLFVFALLLLSQRYFSSADILNNLPSFSENGWERPRNSLLADPVYQFEPWRDFSKRELRNLRFPLWNDLNGNGTPFFANSQSAVLFPINYFYYIFSERISLILIFITKLSLFFLFTYLYLKSIKISSVSSLLGALALTFSGFLILWIYWPQTNVYIFLPLLLFLTEKIKAKGEDGKKYRWYILISICYFLAILGGHPETLFHILLIHYLYILFRFKDAKSKYLFFLVSILIGFLLGAIQLIPFFEYLYYSSALQERSGEIQFLYLPKISFIHNFFPLLFGSPHLSFYKSISVLTNFQESTGGYVGLAVILTGLGGYYLVRKNPFAKYWIFIIITSWIISYMFIPTEILKNLPLINATSNSRLISFAGFGVVVLFCLVIDEIIRRKFKNSNKFYFSNLFYFILILTILIISFLFYSLFPQLNPKYTAYSSQFLFYFMLIALSTIFFFWALFLFVKRKISVNLMYFLLFFIVILQTFGIFWNYNSFVDVKDFYPKTELIKILDKYPKGNIIEVGNPALPANVNLKYGISHVLNNDAMEISWYKKTFDILFPAKNHWKNPDEVNINALKKLNVSYVLSDYDLNLKKQIIQKDGAQILPPLTKKNQYEINFIFPPGKIKQIRFRTANFNRKNICDLNLVITEQNTGNSVLKTDIPCSDIRNNMFYTLSIPELSVQKNQVYRLIIKSNAETDKNAIAFWGKENKPYFELLYEDVNEKNYKLLGKTKSTFVWGVGNGKITNGHDKYRVLYSNPQKLVLDVVSSRSKNLIIEKTFFPGWDAKVNGKKVRIKNSSPFMSIPINQGESYIELKYKPQSFSIGFFITLFTGFFVFIFLIRKEFFEGLSKKFDELRNKLIIKSKNISIWQHALIIFLGIVFSIISYLVVMLIVNPQFKMPFTSSISWYTVHNYPRQQNYFYFFTSVPYIFMMTISIWFFIIWKRKIK